MMEKVLSLIDAAVFLLFPAVSMVPALLSGAPDVSPSIGSPDRPDIMVSLFPGGGCSLPRCRKKVRGNEKGGKK